MSENQHQCIIRCDCLFYVSCLSRVPVMFLSGDVTYMNGVKTMHLSIPNFKYVVEWLAAMWPLVIVLNLGVFFWWQRHMFCVCRADVSVPSRDALAVVTSEGGVSWFPHTIFQSSCSVDVTNFPYDDQQCHMWFGSWTHPRSEVDLEMGYPTGIDLSTFQSDHRDSCAWEILNVTGQRQVMPSEESDPSYTVLTFDISMKRKLVFSSYILTLPCVFLACLTLVVFWLPPDRPDRTALGKFIWK